MKLLGILSLFVLLSAGCATLPAAYSRDQKGFWDQRVVMTAWGFAAIYEPPSLVFGYISWSRNAPTFEEAPPVVPALTLAESVK